jgi:hypothetical protein
VPSTEAVKQGAIPTVCQIDGSQVRSTKPRHVATVPMDLDPHLMSELLGSLESTLDQFGATRIWIDPAGSELSVIAELPEPPGSAT